MQCFPRCFSLSFSSLFSLLSLHPLLQPGLILLRPSFFTFFHLFSFTHASSSSRTRVTTVIRHLLLSYSHFYQQTTHSLSQATLSPSAGLLFKYSEIKNQKLKTTTEQRITDDPTPKIRILHRQSNTFQT